MKKLFAALIAFVTITLSFFAAFSGMGVLVNPKNTDALLVFLPSLLLSVVGAIVCYRTPACREWLASFMFPWPW